MITIEVTVECDIVDCPKRLHLDFDPCEIPSESTLYYIIERNGWINTSEQTFCSKKCANIAESEAKEDGQ